MQKEECNVMKNKDKPTRKIYDRRLDMLFDSLGHIKVINKIERICNYEIPAYERINLIRIEIDGWRSK